MKNLVSFVVLFVLCFFKASATIYTYGEEKIVFASGAIQKNVTWSESFSITENGLETKELGKKQSQDVWMQTHPFPIGLSWRPPSVAYQ